MKKIFILKVLLIASISFIIYSNEKAYALTLDTNNLKIEPVITKGSKKGYYILKYKKNSSYTIKVNITNKSSLKRNYRINVVDGFTNGQGKIEYKTKNSPGGVRNFVTSIPKKEGTIRPGSSKQEIINLKTNSEVMRGVLLGGLQITELADDGNNFISNNLSITTSIVIASNVDRLESNKITNISLKKVTKFSSKSARGFQFQIKNLDNKILKADSIKIILADNHNKLIKSEFIKDITMGPKGIASFFLPYSENFTHRPHTGKLIIKNGKYSHTSNFDLNSNKLHKRISTVKHDKYKIQNLVCAVIVLFIIILYTKGRKT